MISVERNERGECGKRRMVIECFANYSLYLLILINFIGYQYPLAIFISRGDIVMGPACRHFTGHSFTPTPKKRVVVLVVV